MVAPFRTQETASPVAKPSWIIPHQDSANIMRFEGTYATRGAGCVMIGKQLASARSKLAISMVSFPIPSHPLIQIWTWHAFFLFPGCWAEAGDPDRQWLGHTLQWALSKPRGCRWHLYREKEGAQKKKKLHNRTLAAWSLKHPANSNLHLLQFIPWGLFRLLLLYSPLPKPLCFSCQRLFYFA